MNTRRRIRKVAVVGSGIMGSRIAALLAGIGVDVLLLDIAPRELFKDQEAKGLSLEDATVRNSIVNGHWEAAKKSNPASLYRVGDAKLVRTGNLDDHLPEVAHADWIIEVVVERLDIKRQLFEKIEAHRKPGTLITSNTSGIPIHLMIEGRSEDFARHFCGTHFFNPPRYLRLLEVIPTAKTAPEVIDFFMDYGDRFLGKTTVLCKETPAFIANRIGVFGIMAIFHGMEKWNLSVGAIDKLTGPLLGRPKSATFRTADVVGLDTLVHVANGLHAAVPNDEKHALFALPHYISHMMEQQWLGSKSGQGFYKKVKHADGSSEILELNLKTLEYEKGVKAKFATLEATKKIDDIRERIPVLCNGTDEAGAFYRANFAALFSYVSHRIPEITESVKSIDDAMRAGFGWKLGPFQYWDALGVKRGIELMEQEGQPVADWVRVLADNGHDSFYTYDEGQTAVYEPEVSQHQPVTGGNSLILLDAIRSSKTVWSNKESVVIDLGDGVLGFEFRSKMNTLGSGVIQGMKKAIDLAEAQYDALVIGNQAEHFSVGANLAMIFMMAVEQDYDELNFAIRAFQNTMMRVRYSSIPVVVAPHGMTFGGGCEMTLHADAVQASAETYMGLVEFGVGLIPGGGGTKELTMRAADRYLKDDIELNTLREAFLTIGMAQVSKSGFEAFDLGLMKPGRDHISMNLDRQIADAKKLALSMSERGYTQRPQRTDIKVLGRQALGMFEIGAHSMRESNYISDHDRYISQKLAYIMAGGDLSEPAYVSEQYLLDLEREAFLSLCGERKTLERIQHMLNTGKPLRN